MRKKENGSWHYKTSISFIALLAFIAIALTSINACGYLGIFGEASWKEEVLLHDGSKIIVKRWQKLKGRHELGQKPPVGVQSIKFTLPGTKKTIRWQDEYNNNIGMSNYEVLAMHILNGAPYIITSPHGCFSYNLSGRPNPPYVVFKYEHNAWKRIELAELPVEFKNINLVLNTVKHDEKLVSQGLATAEMVQKMNSSLTQEEFKTIIRTPIKIWCEEMIMDGPGRWLSIDIDGFKKQPSYEACFSECKKILFNMKNCPCDRLFKIDSKGEK